MKEEKLLDIFEKRKGFKGSKEKLFILALKKKQFDNLDDLLKAGLDSSFRDFNGRTLLMHVSILGDVELAKKLAINCENVNDVDKLGRNALFYAAKNGNDDLVVKLCEWGADFVYPDKTGKTPLMVAAQSGNTNAVKILIDNGADPDAFDIRGRIPLMFAAKSGKKDVVEELLNRTSAINEVDFFGNSVISHAKRSPNKNNDVLNTLLRKKALRQDLGVNFFERSNKRLKTNDLTI